jgi:hypothetical protein
MANARTRAVPSEYESDVKCAQEAKTKVEQQRSEQLRRQLEASQQAASRLRGTGAKEAQEKLSKQVAELEKQLASSARQLEAVRAERVLLNPQLREACL